MTWQHVVSIVALSVFRGRQRKAEREGETHVYMYEPDTFRVYLASLIYIQYKILS